MSLLALVSNLGFFDYYWIGFLDLLDNYVIWNRHFITKLRITLHN